ncbi:MAG TPA: UGSC family (seleno)protein [Gaiellaceae bacterium]|jgi:hypothetical protein|nr:UGSC family (seleno)protein [Gaiellaceae bacterium]
MYLETEFGVPTVAVHADAFARLVTSVLRVNGMPNARRAFVPTPVMEKTPAELRGYIEGADPVTGRPFMAEVMDALTRTLDENDVRGVDFDRSTPRLLEPDTEENLQRRFRESRWTDFLPVVLPTEERVEAMLQGTSRGRDEIVGRLQPTNYRELWEFTVEKVAVNAVMAGAEPQHLPVILALASSGLTARNSSTSSIAAMVVVNGPIRHEIAMNSGLGALGPYNHANAVIGRAYGILSQNLQGGSVPAETYMGCQGNNMAYNSVTFAENEEGSPWEPYHVSQGFEPETSTASVFMTWGNVWSEGLREHWADKIKAMLVGLDPFLGALLVLDPIVARELAELGFTTRESLKDWIHENVRTEARLYWNHYAAQTFIKEDAVNGIEPFASYLAAPPDEPVPVFPKEKIEVLVVGGSTNAQWSAFSGSRLDRRYWAPGVRTTVSVDDWR